MNNQREYYKELDAKDTQHVDAMYEMMINYARANNLPVAYDEREEILVEAVSKFFVQSRHISWDNEPRKDDDIW